jgi:hypothetical protein
LLAAEADEKVYNLVQLIYGSKNTRGRARITNSRGGAWRTLEIQLPRCGSQLRHPDALQHPEHLDGVLIFDLARDGRE